MRKLLLLLLLTCSFSAFAELDPILFDCYENGVDQNCSERKPIDVSGFDSLVTDFNSNWYYADTISDNSFIGIFWDDTVFSYTYDYDVSTNVGTGTGLNQYETFYAANLTEAENTSDDTLKYKTAFYQNLDMTDTLSINGENYNLSTTGTMIYKIYQLNNETLSMNIESDKISISSDNPVSAIQFGTAEQACELSQTGSYSNAEYSFTISFDDCPAVVYAADSDTNEVYQYTADFSSSQFEFTFGNDVTEMESLGAMQKELYDIEGNWIGYVNFNMFTEEFSVVDQSGNPFVSTN